MATPTNLNPKITQAGLAAAPSPQNPGVQVTLTHVALGTGRYVPTGSETALKGEVARFAITSGTNPSPRVIQVGCTITDIDAFGKSANGKGIGEVGFYAGNTLFAVWSQDADPLFYKTAAFDIPMAYTLDVSALPDSAVTVTVNMAQQGLEALILAHEAKTDPHPQYLTTPRGDARYTPVAHASAADPHTQYLTTARGDGRYTPLAHASAADPHGQYLLRTDAASGYAPLAHTTDADPHTQYLTALRGDGRYTPLAHANAPDPHTQYLTTARGDGRYTPLAHASAADPHGQYLLRTDANQLYAPIGHVNAADPHAQYLTYDRGDNRYTGLGHLDRGSNPNPHPQYMQRSDTNAGFVKQGGGYAQRGNMVYLGWDGAALRAQVDSTDLGGLATQGWVNAVISNVVGAAPSTLDQINELAAAIGNDPNFVVTMSNQLAGKERKFDSGVRLACANLYAPTGWVTVNDDSTNNRMMRVVPTNGSGAGGIHDPTINNVVAPHTHGFSTGGISSDHSHPVYDPGHAHGGGMMVGDMIYSGGGQSYLEEGRGAPDYPRTYMQTAYTGIYLGGVTSNHTHSGSTDNGSSQTNWQPRYLNIIIIQKQ